VSAAYVIGAGAHRFGRFADESVQEIARLAIRNCLDDAGLSPRDVAIAYVANCFHRFFSGQSDAIAPMILGYAGLSGIPMIHVMGGGTAGSIAPQVGAIQNAGAQGGPSNGVAMSAAFILTV
jgi:acetyl-CoA acetyltransferase